jgi:hypothetical protein
MNSLLSSIIAEDATKKEGTDAEVKGIEELFSFMDKRKKKVKSGSTEYTPSEMKKLMTHLDFMV